MTDQEQTGKESPQQGKENQCCGGENHHGEEERCSSKSRDWWGNRSIAEKVLIVIGFGILGMGFLLLLGLVTMKLWNALMPDIFGIKPISYWQAWGLLLLSCILFRSWGCSGESRRQGRKKKTK